jgi:hypothetical protein
LLILHMHNAIVFNSIECRKKQQFSQQRSSAFGDPSSASVLTGTDLVKIQSGQLN